MENWISNNSNGIRDEEYILDFTHLAGAIGYTNCTSAEG